jgi:toxin-antitoxin system PIN domain toxin
MKLIDANVLLYATDRNAQHHGAAKATLDQVLGGTETVLLPWISLLAFVRLVTNPSVYQHPLDIDQALDLVTLWVKQAVATIPEADERHLLRLRELLTATGRGGNLVNDAHLAALATQYGATVLTFDNDFGRFPGVRWQRPITVTLRNGTGHTFEAWFIGRVTYGPHRRQAGRFATRTVPDQHSVQLIAPGETSCPYGLGFLIPADARDDVVFELTIDPGEHETAVFAGPLPAATTAENGLCRSVS